MENRFSIPLLAGIILFGFLLSASSIFFPFYNWDLIPYLASALAYEISDPVELHATTYNLLENTLPAADFTALISGSYGNHMYTNVEDFYSQLKFYDIKPLYTFLLFAVSKIGIPIVHATAVISTGSAILVAILLYHWIGKYTSYPIAFSLAALLLVSTRMAFLARGSSPDVISALIIITSMYLLIEKRSLKTALVLLIFSIFVRANNVIFVTMVTAYYAFFTSDLKIRFKPNFSLLALFTVIAAYLTITISANAYSWWTLFYHSFIEKINNPELVELSFSSTLYLGVLKHFTAALFLSDVFMPSMIFCFTLISFFALYKPNETTKPYIFLIYIIYANYLVYYLVFPSVFEWDRFFAPFYMIITMLAIIGFTTEKHRN